MIVEVGVGVEVIVEVFTADVAVIVCVAVEVGVEVDAGASTPVAAPFANVKFDVVSVPVKLFPAALTVPVMVIPLPETVITFPLTVPESVTTPTPPILAVAVRLVPVSTKTAGKVVVPPAAKGRVIFQF